MLRLAAVLSLALLAAAADPAAQGRRGRAAAPAEPPTPRNEQALVSCPSVLGDGVQTGRTYCDVQVGNDASAGIIVKLPPHDGDVTLTFDLHNRHTYSAELVKEKRAYNRYTANIGIFSMNNDLLREFAIVSEFRTEADLFDRIGGGGGPAGLKAVAPTGIEPITYTIPAEHDAVSIVGKQLHVLHVDGEDTFTTPQRPIALISNVRVTYVPPPDKPAPRKR